MAFGLGDLFTLAVDPSGATLAAKKTAEATAEAAAAAASRGGASHSQASPSGTPTVSVCCEQYKIEGDFLLDTQTGSVWVYNKGAGTFDPVPRTKTALQKMATDLLLKVGKSELESQKAETLARFHFSERPAIEKSYDALIKQMETDLPK